MTLTRTFALGALLLAVGAGPARAADGIPARPKPFTFVTDQANLLEPADEKKLENGLRRYADNTGTQVVVVTVPSLGGKDVNAFARQLGTDWGVGQKDKNNGLVVLVASQEHKLSIEPGSGLRSTITPSVVQRVIGEMTPSFKQNNYARGLQAGLNTLLVTANPGSAPKSNAATSTAATGTSAAGSAAAASATPDNAQAMNDPANVAQAPVEAPSTGLPWGTLLLGGVVIIGGILLLKRLFSRNSSAASTNSGGNPNFYPNQPNNPQPNQPNFYPNQNMGGGYGGAPAQSSGPGIGGILATGAAAAAGAYLGNRMSEGHDSGSAHNFSSDNLGAGAGTGAVAGGTAAADDYFSSRGGDGNNDSSPDYFADNSSSDSSDYFSGNDNSYDDSSGGGGFDDTNNDNSGSW